MNKDVARARVAISACIISHNEGDRIEDCVRSLDFCEEVLVVDSHSTDDTREKAAALGATVIERDWPGYRSQKAFAVAAVKNDWVLSMDADERVSPSMRAEILGLAASEFERCAGFNFPRCTNYFGKFLRRGNAYPDRKTRLFDRRRGGLVGYEVHEAISVRGVCRRLDGDIEHFAYRHYADQVRRLEKYSALMAQEKHKRGKGGAVSGILLRPAFRFVRGYVFRLGFLEGWRGLVYHLAEAHYVRQKYVKLMLLERGAKVE